MTRRSRTNQSAVDVLDKVRRVHGEDDDVDGTLLGDLRATADAVTLAEGVLADARAARDDLIVRAAGLHVPKVTIAETSGLTRAMVDRILKRDDGE